MDSRRGVSPSILIVVLFAVVIGVVGAVLVGGTPAQPTPHAGELVVSLPVGVWGLLFLSPILFGFGVLVWRRLMSDPSMHTRPPILGFVVLVVLALLFIYVLSKAPAGPGSFTLVGSSGSNNTTSTHPGNNSTGSIGSAPVPTVSVLVPYWILLLLVGGLTAVIGALALPGTLNRLLNPRRRRPGAADHHPIDPRHVQQAIAEASRSIERGDDPRQTIILLYLRLLDEFGPRLGNVDYLTAEEIRGVPLTRLHVRPDAAEALTRLFEQARYSTHPIGPEDAGRCLKALHAVEADLSRPPAAS